MPRKDRNPTKRRRPPEGRRGLVFILGLLAGAWLAVQSSGQGDVGAAKRGAADPAQPGMGRLVRVPLPITGTVDTRIKVAVDRLLETLPKDGPRPILVFEFAPKDENAVQGSEFERSLALARYLASERFSRVRTVAYLPQSVRGHAVLAVMACEEIIMAPRAELGKAGIDESSIDPTVRGGYAEIADRRRTIVAPIALGMLDKELVVYRVETDGGPRYVFADELEELKRTATVRAIDTIIPAGEMGYFTGTELRNKHGFVSYLASDRAELARALKLPAGSIELDPSLEGDWKSIRIDIRGPITPDVAMRVRREIEERRNSEGVNFVCLWIDSAGGAPTHSITLAGYLADLDGRSVRTVAYVPSHVRGDASLVALACDHLVMHPQAILGGSGAYEMRNDEVRAAREPVAEAMRRKSRNWSLPMAILDRNLSVYRCTRQGTNVVEYMSDAELAEQPDAAEWIKGAEITRPNNAYEVKGSQAEEVHLARYVVENFEEFKQLYHLEDDPAIIAPNWALGLIDALASPKFASILLFVGCFALFAEVMSPGVGVGAFVSGLCFLLFFWSQMLHGNAGWLEVLLFLGGVTCLALEVFVLPGFGIFGLGGGAMIIASLVLASQTFVIPQNDYQLGQLPISLFMVAAAGAGVFASLAVMRRLLRRTPMLNRVMLEPPEGKALADLQRRESLMDLAHLLGKRGVTTTQLAPSGKARFGDQLVDAISEGELIPRGAAVYVAEVRGNHVLVQAVERQDEGA
jgi:membrane-bound serine protease (ClpP class)